MKRAFEHGLCALDPVYSVLYLYRKEVSDTDLRDPTSEIVRLLQTEGTRHRPDPVRTHLTNGPLYLWDMR